MGLLKCLELFLVLAILLPSFIQCVVIDKTVENRAIELVKQLIQDLEEDSSVPPRVLNVSANNLVKMMMLQCGHHRYNRAQNNTNSITTNLSYTISAHG